MHAGYEKSTEVGISLFQRKSSSYISTPRDNPYAGSTLWVRQVPDQLTVVPSSVLPVVSEEGESEASCSSGTSIFCEGATRVCAISEEASCKSGVHGIVELQLSTAATVSGPTVAVPFILDTGSQYNVISIAVLNILQLKFPGIDIVRPANFSVGMANQTIAPVLGITMAIDVMITSGAAGPLRLGGIEFVVVNGTSDLLLLGHSTMIKRFGIDRR